MSARKIGGIGVAADKSVAVQSRQTRLTLPPASVLIRKNGIEFKSPDPLAAWTEMTVALQSPGEADELTCNAIVVACSGNRHLGYHVSLLFTGLSKQSEQRLSSMADDLVR
jgi:hypothetical protein